MKFSLLAVVLMTFFSQTLTASPMKPYSDEVFNKAQSEGKVILLDFFADWCPTCQKQKAILDELLKNKDFKDYIALKVDYDNAKELRSKMRVPRQSTLILFKGKKEIARSIASTDKKQIDAMLRKAQN